MTNICNISTEWPKDDGNELYNTKLYAILYILYMCSMKLSYPTHSLNHGHNANIAHAHIGIDEIYINIEYFSNSWKRLQKSLNSPKKFPSGSTVLSLKHFPSISQWYNIFNFNDRSFIYFYPSYLSIVYP